MQVVAVKGVSTVGAIFAGHLTPESGPDGRMGQIAVVWGSNMVVYGGYAKYLQSGQQLNNELRYRNEMWSYDVAAHHWTQLSRKTRSATH